MANCLGLARLSAPPNGYNEVYLSEGVCHIEGLIYNVHELRTFEVLLGWFFVDSDFPISCPKIHPGNCGLSSTNCF